MSHNQKNNAGILALNLINYNGEYAEIVGGTQYLVPFSGKNRGAAEGIVELFMDKHARHTESHWVSAKIFDARSAQEAVYGCKAANALNYSYVDITYSKYAFDADLFKRLRGIIDSAVSFDLRRNLDHFFSIDTNR